MARIRSHRPQYCEDEPTVPLFTQTVKRRSAVAAARIYAPRMRDIEVIDGELRLLARAEILDMFRRSPEVVSRFRGHVAQQSSTDDCFVIRFGTKLEPPPGDLHGDHPYVDRLQSRNPRPQRRLLGV
jgi:hypothetical protein